jgi:hypothetical protein
VSLLPYAKRDHKCRVVASHNLYTFIPNLDALRGSYCLKDGLSKVSKIQQLKCPNLVSTFPENCYLDVTLLGKF